MAKAINWLGRILGMLCAAALAIVWAYTLWVPAAGLPLSGFGAVIMALGLVVFAVFAGIASAHGHAGVLMLFFFASFLPIGGWFLVHDHWLKWAGWGDLGLLAAAILLWATARRRV